MATKNLHEPDLLFNPALTLGSQPAPKDTPFLKWAYTDMDSAHENIQWVQFVYTYKEMGMTDKEIANFLSLSVKVAEAGMTLDDIRAFAGIN